MKARSNRGFTLVEIIVIIVVIGILVGMVMALYGNVQKQSRDTKRANDMVVLQNALKKYYDANGQYPFSCNYTGTAVCATTSTSFQSSTGSAPLSTIGSATSVATLRTLMPALDDSFGDPKSGAGNTFDIQAKAGSLYLSKNAYFFLSMDLYNLGTTAYLATNDAATTYITCNYSAIGNNKSGVAKADASHYYVIGYFSEVQNKWIFIQGPFDNSVNDLRWNYDNKPECVPQSI